MIKPTIFVGLGTTGQVEFATPATITDRGVDFDK